MNTNKKHKTIYINEDVLKRKVLVNSVLPETLPESFDKYFSSGNGPFKENLAFPSLDDENFLLKTLKDSYLSAKENLVSLKRIDGVSGNNLNYALSQLVTKATKVEEPHRDQLEKLCNNIVIDMFNIPEDIITIDSNLQNEVSENGEFPLFAEKIPVDFKDYADMEYFKKEVKKRKVINLLIAGASQELSADISLYVKEIYDINPELIDLYRKILPLNQYVLFNEPEIEFSEKDKKQIGTVMVDLGGEDKKTLISPTAVIFPVLLYETIQGLMELFASHGLPNDKYRAYAILKRTDYIKMEPWNMRIGPELWKKFKKASGDLGTEMIPYVFQKVCTLSPTKFNKLMREIFIGSQKGKNMMATLIDDIEYNSFVEKMKKANLNKNIIEDEYIHPEELN